jgi:KDO2-lipid IV(A) lauroyltransferase
MADRLVRVEQRTTHLLHVHREGAGSALRATGISRLVPAPVAIAGAVAAGRAAWMHPGRRVRARRWAELVAPGLGPARTNRLARRHLVELAVQSELFWRAGSAHRLAIDGVEHLDAALARGRGAIVAFPHVGPITYVPIAVAARHGRAYIARRPNHAAGLVTGREGRWIKLQRGAIEDAGGRLLTRGGTFDLLQALLARGEVVLISWDRLGDGRVEFLGRELGVGKGTDRLAAVSGAPVVPALAFRERHRARIRMWPAVEPDADGRVVPALARIAEEGLRPRPAQANDTLAAWLAGKAGSL